MTDAAPGARPGLGKGYGFLVATQFLGAVNDHYLKMLVSLLAIEQGLREHRGVGYLTLSGIALILPYLLLSGYAGGLADRFNKRSVLIASKALEVVLGVLVLAALLYGEIVPLVATLFLLGAQSVFFSPAKYGILPELLPASELSRANGFLEFGRYVAIICGTVLGGGLMQVWSNAPALLGGVVVVVAVAGWLCSLGIGRVAFDGKPAPLALNPWGELWGEARRIATERRLRSLVLGTTGFDAAVTLLLMAILLFARQTMGLGELDVGLLAGAAGVGVGLGCALVGRLSGRRIELAFVPIGAIGAGLVFVLLGISERAFALTLTLIIVAAAFAGFVLVPLYAALQRRAASADRGKIIAANNFLNMAGVLAGSLALWLFHDGLGVSPAGIFVGGGALLILVSLIGLGQDRWARLKVYLILRRLLPGAGRRRAGRRRARAWSSGTASELSVATGTAAPPGPSRQPEAGDVGAR